MSNTVFITERDRAVLRLLEMTPATASQIRKVSIAFPGEPFPDERRVRERLQAVAQAGLIQFYPIAVAGGGRSQYYRLTPAGFKAIGHDEGRPPSRSIFEAVSPSRITHAMAVADIIVHVLVACHSSGVTVSQFHGDGRIILSIGEFRQSPDCHFQFGYGGKTFNILFEIDNATEPVESGREQCIQTKILGYEAYQDWVLKLVKQSKSSQPEPRFRVVFLTLSETRARHILSTARNCARNRDRRICLASTQSAFLAQQNPLLDPFLLDHNAQPITLVNRYRYRKSPFPLRKH